MDAADLARVVAWLDTADRVLFITGAGISAESGMPTYRGVAGLYEHDDTVDGVPIEVALSGPMFARDPALTWKHILTIEQACRDVTPSLAHQLVARMQARLPEAFVLTQNVDGLHQRAGSETIAIHGDLHTLLCEACGWRSPVDDYAHLDPVPRCPSCGAVIRPDVVLFGELLPLPALEAYRTTRVPAPDLVFSIGTTSVFPYIAAPVWEARGAGGHTIEINPGDTEVSDAVDVRFRTGAGEALAALWTAWTGEPA